MNLELNLVRTSDVYSSVFQILNRARKVIESPEDAMIEVCNFIRENAPTFDAALYNKKLVSDLQDLQSLTIDQFMGLKFMLANSGVDILITEVSDVEVNQEVIADGMMEYNVLSYNSSVSGFIPFCSKIVVSENDGDLGGTYEKIMNMHSYFEGEIFSGYNNPLMNKISVIKSNEAAVGDFPLSISSAINSTLEYLGNRIIAITN